jgi:hypothetical protein
MQLDELEICRVAFADELKIYGVPLQSTDFVDKHRFQPTKIFGGLFMLLFPADVDGSLCALE